MSSRSSAGKLACDPCRRESKVATSGLSWARDACIRLTREDWRRKVMARDVNELPALRLGGGYICTCTSIKSWLGLGSFCMNL